VDGQRKLAGRKRFWDKWAKEHRRLIKQVEEDVDELKSLAIVGRFKSLTVTLPDALLSRRLLKSNSVWQRDREAHPMNLRVHWLHT
jgi:hypothetical protein